VTAIINRELATLPESYRRSLFTDGHIIDRYMPTPIWYLKEHDPSEAIRSDEIVDKLKKWFNIVEYKPYGGAVFRLLAEWSG